MLSCIMKHLLIFRVGTCLSLYGCIWVVSSGCNKPPRRYHLYHVYRLSTCPVLVVNTFYMIPYTIHIGCEHLVYKIIHHTGCTGAGCEHVVYDIIYHTGCTCVDCEHLVYNDTIHHTGRTCVVCEYIIPYIILVCPVMVMIIILHSTANALQLLPVPIRHTVLSHMRWFQSFWLHAVAVVPCGLEPPCTVVLPITHPVVSVIPCGNGCRYSTLYRLWPVDVNPSMWYHTHCADYPPVAVRPLDLPPHLLSAAESAVYYISYINLHWPSDVYHTVSTQTNTHVPSLRRWPQQTRGIEPMLGWCWAAVEDGGQHQPTIGTMSRVWEGPSTFLFAKRFFGFGRKSFVTISLDLVKIMT